MTSGSSQGLFVIVAVVIFGIFAVISYLLFRDKLQTGLASIFDDSISTTKGQATPNPNLIKYSSFETLEGWTQNEPSIVTLGGNGEAILSKPEFSDRRGGIYLASNNALKPELDKYYSASIEIYIEDYVIKEGQTGGASNFYLRTTLINGIGYDFGAVNISNMEKGKWIKLTINGVKPHPDTASNSYIEYSVAIDMNVKAKIRVRNPKLEFSKTSTDYVK